MFSVWLVEQPAVAVRIDRLAEYLSEAWEDEPAPEPDALASAEPATTAPRRAIDCAAESVYVEERIVSARACRDDLDCVISAPRQRCIVPLRVGMAGAIEDDMLRLAGTCADRLELPTLDSLCREPDRAWVPYCRAGICDLHDSFDSTR